MLKDKLLSFLSLLSLRCPLWLFVLFIMLTIFILNRKIELEVPDKVKFSLQENSHGGSQMDVNNPNSANTWVSDDGKAVHIKMIDIGFWDMDSTDWKGIVHGIADHKKIVFINAYIFGDNGVTYKSLIQYDQIKNNGIFSGGVRAINNVEIELQRVIGGDFDLPAFSNGGINRGTLVIMYYQ